MPYRIGGYYMSFSTIYKVMEALEIPNPLNYDDALLEFGISFWLCDQNKFDVLAAFKYIPYSMPDSGDFEESDRDLAIVRDWLMNGTDVKAGELKWITVLVNRKITAT
ncbi:uncharacterized protein ARMOST_01516 [Armillaria ostoyae]|uniref:Uncharacterized protein n=1 Tax=Armillaria ostoyae TaxID=47428 RepID=A0A284QP60_ARMOS|nr:uncharacterized protein ARMOST_01516 [Armillaria ostoyae]